MYKDFFVSLSVYRFPFRIRSFLKLCRNVCNATECVWMSAAG